MERETTVKNSNGNIMKSLLVLSREQNAMPLEKRLG
jgi:hypothetical protein